MLDRHIIAHLLENPPETLACKVSVTVGMHKVPSRVVADACGVTVQAVNNWRKNGRVDKKHIATLAKLTGLPIAWWMPGYRPTVEQTFWPFGPWVSYTDVAVLPPGDLGYLAGRLQEALRDLQRAHKQVKQS